MSNRPEQQLTHRVLRHRQGWVPASPQEIWRFRELIVRFAARDVTLRYRQAALGIFWVIAQPLFGAGILSFVFGNVAGLQAPEDCPYVVFAMIGMVAWIAFSQVLLRASGSLLSNAPLLTKASFPRLVLPISAVLSSMVDVVVPMFLVLILLAWNGVVPTLAIVTLPAWLLLLAELGLGIGLATGALVVRYRDVSYVLPVILQGLLFLSPVAYTLSSVPVGARTLYELNPLVGLLEGFRWSLLGSSAPPIGLTCYSTLATLFIFAAGLLLFSRMETIFADVI